MMKRVTVDSTARRARGERRRLLREYFLNALTLALMKEAGTLGAPTPARVRPPARPAARA
jgi:hypothetical protein